LDELNLLLPKDVFEISQEIILKNWKKEEYEHLGTVFQYDQTKKKSLR